MGEQGGGEDSDLVVVVHPWVEIGSARESIGFVGSAWEVNKGEVVVCKTGNITRNASIDVLWVAVVFEVLVVSVYSDRGLGSHKKVSPVGEAPYDGQEFCYEPDNGVLLLDLSVSLYTE